MAPHSRHTTADEDAIRANRELVVLAESREAGIFLVISRDNSQIFCMGHPEYDRMTLDKEYKRDLDRGLDIAMPVNYYPDNDINQKPLLQWRSHANCLYTNFLDYYVYQMTPYDLHWLPKDRR
jgi:homoserine O-succinyltransferase